MLSNSVSFKTLLAALGEEWASSAFCPLLGVALLSSASPASAATALHQLIQQRPDAVVLLGGAGYRLVAHGADAAHLQPLHQAPVPKDRAGNEKPANAFGYCRRRFSVIQEQAGASSAAQSHQPSQKASDELTKPFGTGGENQSRCRWRHSGLLLDHLDRCSSYFSTQVFSQIHAEDCTVALSISKTREPPPQI